MYNFGTLVLGAEIDYDLTDMSAEVDTGDLISTLGVDSILRLKARVGYDAGSFLPYLTGGVVRATLTGGPTDTEAEGDFYGLGAAYKFSDSILVGGEVLQHTIYEGDIMPGAGLRATTATARLSFRF